MTRTLAQVIAVERRLRQQDNDKGREIRTSLSETRVSGVLTEYKPDAEEDTLPASERGTIQYQVVQARVEEGLQLARKYSELAIDAVATKDSTNCEAKAGVIVDGTELISAAPVSHLLWLENYLQEWRAFLAGLPVLTSTKSWKLDTEDGLHKAAPEIVPRTSKRPVPLVLHPGTDKHPPQVTTYQEDVKIGRKFTTAHSGAIPESRKRELLERCDKLIMAVRDATARANQTPVTEIEGEGAKLLGYILGQ